MAPSARWWLFRFAAFGGAVGCAWLVGGEFDRKGRESASSDSGNDDGANALVEFDFDGGTGDATVTAPTDAAEKCDPLPQDCVDGSLSICRGTGCAYVHAGHRYACVSCGDCTSALDQAINACFGSSGSCANLRTCCLAMSDPSPSRTQCLGTWEIYATYAADSGTSQDPQCKTVLDSYRAQGKCP